MIFFSGYDDYTYKIRRGNMYLTLHFGNIDIEVPKGILTMISIMCTIIY